MTIRRIAWLMLITILFCSSAIILQGCSVLAFHTQFIMQRPKNSIAIPDTNVTYTPYEFRSEAYHIRAYSVFSEGWGFFGIPVIPLFPFFPSHKDEKLILNVEILNGENQNDTTQLKASIIVNSGIRSVDAIRSSPYGDLLPDRRKYSYDFNISPDTVETFTLQLGGSTPGAIPPLTFGKKTSIDYTPWYFPGMEPRRPQADSSELHK